MSEAGGASRRVMASAGFSHTSCRGAGGRVAAVMFLLSQGRGVADEAQVRSRGGCGSAGESPERREHHPQKHVGSMKQRGRVQ